MGKEVHEKDEESSPNLPKMIKKKKTIIELLLYTKDTYTSVEYHMKMYNIEHLISRRGLTQLLLIETLNSSYIVRTPIHQ